jgi:hypothetical protein
VVVHFGLFAPNIPQARKLFRTHLMVLQDGEALVEARLILFGDSARVDAI